MVSDGYGMGRVLGALGGLFWTTVRYRKQDKTGPDPAVLGLKDARGRSLWGRLWERLPWLDLGLFP